MGLELLEGENVVLEDAGISRNLILTNMRPIFFEQKGLIRISSHMKTEIPLEQIEEAYVEPGGAFGGVLLC